MSYQINKTNGELLVDLADGQIDNVSTDITLVGRNYKGFGESFNENFVKIVENFASASAPNNPLEGQVWFDTSEQRLKVYTDEGFKSAGGTIVSASQPTLNEGDIWLDTLNKKMYFKVGSGDPILVGPSYDDSEGKSGIEVDTVTDTSSLKRVIVKLFIAGSIFGIWSSADFRLSGERKIPGYPDDPDDTISPPRQLILKGFNPVDVDYWYRGTASNARALVDAEGNSKTSANFLPADGDGETVGSITIKNSNGLSIGVDDTQYAKLYISGNRTYLEQQRKDTDFSIRTKRGNITEDAIYIDASARRIGFFTDTPQTALDIDGDFQTTGNVSIGGDLIVEGNTTYFNVSTLRVEDKNIELGLLDDSTEGADADVDGAGITVRSSDGSKDLYWDLTNDSWTSNQNFDLKSGKTYKIGGNTILSRTALATSVTSANGLTSIGTLNLLNVDNINLNGNTITTIGGGLTLDLAGSLNVDGNKITNLGTPTATTDAATKDYVDTQTTSINVGIALDITGLTTPTAENPYTDVASILNDLHPASALQDGTQAKVHCTSYAGATVSGIDIESVKNISYISVLSDDSSAQSVVQDVAFSNPSGTISLSPTRSTMTFEVSGGSWAWQNTI